MFGYIKPQKSELLVREYEQYRGVYCSLCKQLGKSYGSVSRMTLSYDCTFLALVMMGLSEECPEFQVGKCVVNPLKKCTYCNGGKSSLMFSSALSVILTYYKIKDDLQDSHFLGKLRAWLLLPLAIRPHNKAVKEYPEIEKVVRKSIESQKELESAKETSIDAAAEPTARMLSDLFTMITDDETEKLVLKQFGYFLGRWVYLIDAADDLEKDRKNDSFNPFITRYNINKDSSSDEIQFAKENCNEVLNLTLSQAVVALQLLQWNFFGPIITNIILLGLGAVQKELLFFSEKEKKNV